MADCEEEIVELRHEIVGLQREVSELHHTIEVLQDSFTKRHEDLQHTCIMLLNKIKALENFK